jgi:hypothetical protein
LPAELLDIGDPSAQTVEMAAQAIAVGIAPFVLSLELPELEPQTIELGAKPIASHALCFSKSPARNQASGRIFSD